ncbi:ABC transporter B family member 13-like [Prunus yedoensis var. nudiflora]|uniref:ABC transporter B family member 13-like n=1 Tax=Prunus yedoensis var. nudiflora TaxID=2094558 RepID=A0A314UJQ0_PRUYE|nr:ABC transporter B family member 13-like [Prunus yedoensis var. nudiflora]
MAREAIANIRTVASFGCEERIAIQFASELNQPNKQAIIRGHISGFCYGLSQFFAFCSYALGLWYASILIKHKDSNFGDIMKSFMVLIMSSYAREMEGVLLCKSPHRKRPDVEYWRGLMIWNARTIAYGFDCRLLECLEGVCYNSL